MDFVANSEEQNKKIKKTLGIEEVVELFRQAPSSLIHPAPAEEDGLSEMEGIRRIQEIAKENTHLDFDSYLGAGAYDHYVPSVVSAITSKSEFLTSYTPYQAEASQGMLQAIFEFQSCIAALTGLDVSNASVYDAASALAESALMALRMKKAHKVLVSETIHPSYRAVLDQYLSHDGLEAEIVPMTKEGTTDFDKMRSLLSEETAAVLIQSPNFFGILEEAEPLRGELNALNIPLILSANPLSFGLFKSAKEQGATIVCGDTQPFGLPLQFGGPFCGYIASDKRYLRQLPGRLVGETVDSEGRRAFTLTLQAREQHIRRDKATSNICTNQALAALASLVGLLWYGKEGIKELALTNYQRASYLKKGLQKNLFSNHETFNEFVVHFETPHEKVKEAFHKEKIHPGLHLGRFYPQLENHWLVTVTEKKTKAQLDHFLEVAERL